MNLIIITTIAVLFVYLILTRLAIRKLIKTVAFWRNEAIRLNEELLTVNNQYRQLAKILEALKTIKK